MDFIISNKQQDNYQNTMKVGSYFLDYTLNHKIKSREFVLENEHFLIIGDTNLGFSKRIIGSRIELNLIKHNINSLKNGFVIFVNKLEKSIKVFNDIFGFYHLFYKKEMNCMILSNKFDELIPFSDKVIDTFSILDLYLFNYTLIERTIIKDIKRVRGGSLIDIYTTKIKSKYNFADNYNLKNKKNKINYKTYSELLKGILDVEIDRKEKINVTMTAGFDSRTLLALCCKLQIDFDSFTFGQSGNIEIETIRPFINDFSIKHNFINLDKSFVSDLPKHYYNFIKANLDNPVILDTPHYSYVNDLIEPSSLIVGFMGGEMLEGQSIGAQVTFTDIAGELLSGENKNSLVEIIIERIRKDQLLSDFYDLEIISRYVETVKKYFYKKDRINVLDFLINEKYSKFFGSINKVFRNKQNIIVPIMDDDLLSMILNSKLSFLDKIPFKHNPLDNLKSKKLHAKTIKYLCPKLKDTKFDRLYCVNDLCNPLRLPFAALGYFKSHFLKTNKVKFPRPHSYDEWYKNLIILKNWEDNRYINQKFIFDENSYDNLNSRTKKMTASLMGIFDSYMKILEIEND